MFDQKVYEILAKWIAERSNVTVDLKVNGRPQSNPEHGHIELPYNIREEHIFPALALLMHEASHIRESTYDPEPIIEDESYFPILNAVEDARIDAGNFGRLPNVREFYRGLYTKERAKTILEKADEQDKQLCACIYEHLSFTSHLPYRMRSKPEVFNAFKSMARALDNVQYWTKYNQDAYELSRAITVANERFKTLCSALGVPPPQKQPKDGKGGKNGQGKGKGEGAGAGHQQQSGEGDAPVPGDHDGSEGNQGGDVAPPKENPFLKGGGRLHEIAKRDVFATTDSYTPNDIELPHLFFQEQTKQALQEMLNQKLTVTKEDGRKLNTDSLVSFFTGDVDPLFVEDEVVVKKKAKIIFLVDGSGSMHDALVDKAPKIRLIKDVMFNIVTAIDEVRELEGQEIDYTLAKFSYDVYPYDSLQHFIENFHAGGGTHLSHAFHWAIQEISKEDLNVGARIVVCITDGEVSNDQVEHMKQVLQQTPNEIKVVLLGIGCDIAGSFVKTLIGNDRNIMIKDHADMAVMNAVMEALN